MKRYFGLLYLFGVITCFILCYYFFCNYEIIAYHLIIQTVFFSVILAINILVSRSFKIINTVRIICNTINAGFFLLSVSFYLLVIGSNYFWKRTITISLLKDYLPLLKELALVIPIEPAIYIGIIVLWVSLLIFLLIWSLPSVKALTFFKNLYISKRVIWIGVSANYAGTATFVYVKPDDACTYTYRKQNLFFRRAGPTIQIQRFKF